MCSGWVDGLPAAGQPAMGRDPPTLEKDLDDGGGQSRLDALVDELIGDAVVVVRDLDVVIDVHAAVRPHRELVGRRRQGPERGAIELLEELAPGDAELLHRARIERRQELADRRVQLGEVEEAAVAERREDPSLGQEHTRLRLRLIPWAATPRGHDRDPVVAGELRGTSG